MPKRSAGCFACRARKVRCDETKPECNTCVRRGAKCPGYRPAQAFIHHEFDDERGPAVIREDETQYIYINQTESSSRSRESAAVVMHRTTPRIVDVPVPQQVSTVAADRIQYLDSFVTLYLPNERGKPLTPPSALVMALPYTPTSREVLAAALDSVSAAQLAIVHRSLPLIYRSRALYGVALGLLMRSITNRTSSFEDETLFAMYLLAIYEVFVGITNGNGFFYHVQGLMRLLRERGPESIKRRALTLNLFHGIRYFCVGLGLTLRRASMLDTPSWLAITAETAKISSWVALMDICIQIPRLLERYDKLTQGSSPSSEFSTLLSDCNKLHQSSQAWFSSFEKNGIPHYSPVPISEIEGYSGISYDGKSYKTVFKFTSFGTSNTYMLYWMSILILRSTMFTITRTLSTTLPLTPLQIYAWVSELDAYAHSICRGVPFSTRPAAGFTGRFATLGPLSVAQRYFAKVGNEKEAKWCEDAFLGTSVPGLYTPPLTIQAEKHRARRELEREDVV
ncbi:hypothetical protein GQ43DRAFT_409806 [Delitschia confertaspora ATCC 74209]|uniref:Zn(2)-C6 fungal-type domain-containing protein n=1 Tax=Delitschia confertaspora ATCC 74209 TaxID=1513339 RepID=A0A9P4JW10_9PLEO|nr:hypothetical protein GQ43DRAFT_409806 [Delitschia confertaspora ATCC 74209]